MKGRGKGKEKGYRCRERERGRENKGAVRGKTGEGRRGEMKGNKSGDNLFLALIKIVDLPETQSLQVARERDRGMKGRC